MALRFFALLHWSTVCSNHAEFILAPWWSTWQLPSGSSRCEFSPIECTVIICFIILYYTNISVNDNSYVNVSSTSGYLVVKSNLPRSNPDNAAMVNKPRRDSRRKLYEGERNIPVTELMFNRSIFMSSHDSRDFLLWQTICLMNIVITNIFRDRVTMNKDYHHHRFKAPVILFTKNILARQVYVHLLCR